MDIYELMSAGKRGLLGSFQQGKYCRQRPTPNNRLE